MCWATAVILSIIGLLIAFGARAEESSVLYKDGNWGVVQQNNSRTCIIVLNTDDRRHAFHFLIDGEEKAARVGILQEFLPDTQYLTASKTMVFVDLGLGFARRLAFRPGSDGISNYIAAELSRDDLDRVLSTLEATHGVSISFSNGAEWHVRPPDQKAAKPAIDQCWNRAVNGADNVR